MNIITKTILLICILCVSPNIVFGETQPPNVVLIYADDFGMGDLSYYNKDPKYFRYTPHLDRMFSEGVTLSNYMTHCVCSPSRAGLLTGRHYANVRSGPLTGGTLPNDIRNVAKDFQEAGYKTGAFGKWHNGHPPFPEDGNGKRADYGSEGVYNELHRSKTLDLNDNIFSNHKGYKWGPGVNAYGFDRFVGYYNGGGDLFDRYVNWHHDIDWWHDGHYRAAEKGYTTDLITQHALTFIEENAKGPFFCYIPQQAVHSPIQLKRSDLKEFCEKLDTQLGMKGQWEFVAKQKSPTSGRLLGEVEELRFTSGEEFSLTALDAEKEHLAPLIYAAYCYTLDKSVGKVIAKIEELGLSDNTILFFASDNGATSQGCNLPLSGGKHSLWEGGINVPAALWWPSRFDCNTKPYSKKDNNYDGLIAYFDIYPTLLAMTGQTCQAKELDGLNCWPALQKRAETRPSAVLDAIHWMWSSGGAIRTNRWKLFYSQAGSLVTLYDLDNDVGETQDVAEKYPEVAQKLSQAYQDWLTKNNYAMSYAAIPKENIASPKPQPQGEMLEIKATQTAKLNNPGRDGLYIRFASGSFGGDRYDGYVHPGDRVEFDIYVCPDSEITQGCYYTPGSGWSPFFTSRSGFNSDGEKIIALDLPKGVWTRQVVGVGNLCPGGIPVNLIALTSKKPGYYHYYLDNIVLRKADGTVRAVLWESKKDFSPITYIHKNRRERSLQKFEATKGFAFEDVEVRTCVKTN